MSELEENQNIDNHENEEREYNETQNSQTQNDNGMSKTQPLGKKNYLQFKKRIKIKQLEWVKQCQILHQKKICLI